MEDGDDGLICWNSRLQPFGYGNACAMDIFSVNDGKGNFTNCD
jgi:hypothetical protein